MAQDGVYNGIHFVALPRRPSTYGSALGSSFSHWVFLLDKESAEVVRAGALIERVSEENFVGSALTVRLLALAEAVEARADFAKAAASSVADKNHLN